MNRLKFSNLKLQTYKDEFIIVRRTGLSEPNNVVAILVPLNNKVINAYYGFKLEGSELTECKYVANLNVERVQPFLSALFKNLSNTDLAVSINLWITNTKLEVKSVPSMLAELYTSASDEDFFDE